MNFRTELPFPSFPFSFSHKDRFILMGSCFAENIGQKLQDHFFHTNINPFGICFNPVSLARQIDTAVNQNLDLDLFFTQTNGKTVNHFYHSSLFGNSESELNTKLEESNAHFTKQLKTCSCVVLSIGTAWVHRLISEKTIIANCHKQGGHLFTKEILSLNECLEALQSIEKSLLSINPSLKILLTLSPIRHTKDGMVENQRSKSTLHVAIQEMVLKSRSCFYFPSYELILDDLRDYRFYTEDLIHPNPFAISYIWKYVEKSLLTEGSRDLNKIISKLQKSLTHKSTFEEKEGREKFVKKNLQILDQIEPKLAIKLEKERKYMGDLLA